MARSSVPRPIDVRGQTGIDFVVGVGIFLLTMAFVVGFVPGMFAPFGHGTQAPIVADRAADSLIYGNWSAAPGTVTLNDTKTDRFFSAPPAGTTFGISSTRWNVTLENGTATLSAGRPVPTDGASVSTATRVVYYRGADARVVVSTW